jgi:hypothetical protein
MQNPIIVTDENVAKFHLEKIQNLFNAKSIIVPAGEEHKNLETVSRLWDAFLENGLDRKSTVIALGGGVIGDMAGFAASTYMRGIDWIAVPPHCLRWWMLRWAGRLASTCRKGRTSSARFIPRSWSLQTQAFCLRCQSANYVQAWRRWSSMASSQTLTCSPCAARHGLGESQSRRSGQTRDGGEDKGHRSRPV